VETLGVFNSSACLLLNEIGKRLSVNTGESRETGFLFQRASVPKFSNLVHTCLLSQT